MPPENCPNCGADVPPKAKACPECGACEETGWTEEAHTSGLDLPDDSFDYEDYVQREFGEKKELVPRGISKFWWCSALLLVVALLWLVLFGGF